MKRWSRVGPLVLIGVVAIFVVAATIVIKREALGVNRVTLFSHQPATLPSTSASALPSPTVTPVSSATPTPTPTATSVAAPATPGASAGASAGGGEAVLLGPSAVGPHRHVVSIVTAAGTVIASAEGADRSARVAGGTQLPMVSASQGTVYFLDGDGLVRFLRPNGQTGVAARVGGTDQVHAAFAVSPDDWRIAVSTIDYSTNPPRLRLDVQDLNGAHSSEILTSTSTYLWPVGWHAGNLVLAVGDAFPTTDTHFGSEYEFCDATFGPCVADNPYGATHGYRVIDPTNGTIVATLASGDCPAIGLLTPVGTVCRTGHPAAGLITPTQECRVDLTFCLRLVDWTGGITEWTTIATVWVGAIAPDGSGMAACCNVDAINLYDSRSAGASSVFIRKSAWPLAFLDPFHLLYRPFGVQGVHVIGTNGSGDVPLVAPGSPVASLPGGF